MHLVSRVILQYFISRDQAARAIGEEHLAPGHHRRANLARLDQAASVSKMGQTPREAESARNRVQGGALDRSGC